MRPTQRLTGRHGALLVVDLQDKLLGLIPDRDVVVANTVALIRAARALGLPVSATEQYPQGLGPSTAAIAELHPGSGRPRRRSIAAPCRSSWSSSTAGMSATSQWRGSRHMSAWPRPLSNCSTWVSASRFRPMP